MMAWLDVILDIQSHTAFDHVSRSRGRRLFAHALPWHTVQSLEQPWLVRTAI